MVRRITMLWALSLIVCLSLAAQQAPPPQPLTMWYDYTVNAGKEDDFMTLVKTVGQPVRDKLMAEGVVMAWGIETPILRGPGNPTHMVWVSVNDWAGVGKVNQAMADQLAKLAADEAKAVKKPAMTTAQRSRETFDASKTRDWLTRDLVFGLSSKMPANAMPFTRYNMVKVKPGKGSEYRTTWEKYNKPVLDKAIADGVILGYGFAVEELRTEGSFTHFTWIAANNMADWDRFRAAFMADRAGRGPDERNAISAALANAVDGDASRQFVTRSIMFKVAAPK